MKLSTAVFLTLLAAISTSPLSTSMAGELSTVINGKSFHLNSEYQWNEKNYGLGFEYSFDTKSRWRKAVMVNGFRDSNNTMSYMAGGGLHYRVLQSERFSGFYVDAGIIAFMMTREDINGNKPFPGALPSLSLGNRYAGFNFTYLPREMVKQAYAGRRIDPNISGVLYVQLKVNIGQILHH